MLKFQSVFNTIVTKLMAQGRPAFTPSGYDPLVGSCNYRTEDGRGCAVGVLMSDEMATRQDLGTMQANRLPMDVQAYLTDTVMGAEDNDQRTQAMNFLMAMQNAHDAPALDKHAPSWVEEFKLRASQVAAQYELDQAVLSGQPDIVEV